MPKNGNTTEFWKRLTKARTSCAPPKSMRQQDIAREYGYAHQSAVTKIKTGGPDGNSMPSPDVVTRMALDTGVNVNWLWAGQGEMTDGDLQTVAYTHASVRANTHGLRLEALRPA